MQLNKSWQNLIANNLTHRINIWPVIFMVVIQYPQPNTDLCIKYHKADSSSSELNDTFAPQPTFIYIHIKKGCPHTQITPHLLSSIFDCLFSTSGDWWQLETFCPSISITVILSVNKPVKFKVAGVFSNTKITRQDITQHSTGLQMTYQVNSLCSGSRLFSLLTNQSPPRKHEECHSSSLNRWQEVSCFLRLLWKHCESCASWEATYLIGFLFTIACCDSHLLDQHYVEWHEGCHLKKEKRHAHKSCYPVMMFTDCSMSVDNILETPLKKRNTV